MVLTNLREVFVGLTVTVVVFAVAGFGSGLNGLLANFLVAHTRPSSCLAFPFAIGIGASVAEVRQVVDLTVAIVVFAITDFR